MADQGGRVRLQEQNIMGCTGDGIGCKNKERESYQRILSPRQKLRKFLITVEPGSSKLSPVTAPAAPCQPPVCPVELPVRPVEPPVHPAEGELLVEAWHRSWQTLSRWSSFRCHNFGIVAQNLIPIGTPVTKPLQLLSP